MLGVTLLNMLTEGHQLFRSAIPSDEIYGSIFYRKNPEHPGPCEDTPQFKLRKLLSSKFNSDIDDSLIGLLCDMLHPEPARRPNIRTIIESSKWLNANNDISYAF